MSWRERLEGAGVVDREKRVCRRMPLRNATLM